MENQQCTQSTTAVRQNMATSEYPNLCGFYQNISKFMMTIGHNK